MGKVRILNTPTIVPETYIQFPDMLPPSMVYGGMWHVVFDDEGVFFRTGGGEASAFNSGIQESAVGEHAHSMTFRRTDKAGNTTATVLSYNENRHGNITYNTSPNGEGIGIETRPINRTMRVWKRGVL